ncbi:hypothetical protein Sjap_023585 [Stephania japonica]|uniref:Uncharacterized protein n=1 Tax=Stephania japonica TaxID=461633 RepID=A0AAP0EH40_9MAGN
MSINREYQWSFPQPHIHLTTYFKWEISYKERNKKFLFNVEKSTARTEEEKKIAKEKRKAKEHGAKTELHAAKAAHNHMAEKLNAKRAQQGPMVGTHGAPVGAAYGHHYGPLLGTHGASC